MGKPNLKEFLKETHSIGFSSEQKKLAEALINYRTIHFSLGLRGGRTTVVNAVQAYFQNMYPSFKDAGREI